MDTKNLKHNVCNSDSEGPTFAPMESLKERRERVVGRQIDMAKKCGCHHTHISHIESGHTDPSYPLLLRMTAVLKVSLERLVEMLESRHNTATVTDLQKARERRKAR
jgi:transcriptional regulator with XRE-family HTH domain